MLLNCFSAAFGQTTTVSKQGQNIGNGRAYVAPVTTKTYVTPAAKSATYTPPAKTYVTPPSSTIKTSNRSINTGRYKSSITEEVDSKRDYVIETGCLTGDCKNGIGFYRYWSGETFDGVYKDGRYNGFGTLTQYVGLNSSGVIGRYKGNFVNGLRHGFGKETSTEPNGVRNEYEGYFVNGLYEGEGYLTNSNGRIYKGSFKSGKRHGKGVTSSASSSKKFTGLYANDMANGFGTEEGYEENSEGNFVNDWPEGKIIIWDRFKISKMFEGIYADKKRNGKGKEWDKDRSWVEGTWINGLREGMFKAYNADSSFRGQAFYVKDVTKDLAAISPPPVIVDETLVHTIMDKKRLYPTYIGQMRYGSYHGRGVKYFEGSMMKNYEGEFAVDRFNGKGILYNHKGDTVYNGHFVHGYTEGEGIMYGLVEEGSVFKGEFKDGVIERGTLYRKDGAILYNGLWVRNTPSQCLGNCQEGIGKLYNTDNDHYYLGQWKGGLRHGIGKEFENNGQIIYEGEFLKDNRHGTGTIYQHNSAHHVTGKFVAGKLEGKATLFYGYPTTGFTEQKSMWKNGVQVEK